jgi:hypothetical protein
MPQPAPIRPQEEHASESLPAAKVPATSATALPSVSQTPRTKKAPRRPPAHKATTALKREESGRVRRTMRFPAALDAMLCELARSQGVTLNAAVALAIQAEWQRIRGTRSGA